MDFTKLTAYIDSLYSVSVPACDLIVYRDHEMLYRHMSGWRDMEKTVPLTGDETYNMYSCSKVMTSCAVMQLIGSGKLDLDDPVSKWLPEYASLKVKGPDGVHPAKNTLTVRHLLSMQGGFDYNLASSSILETNRAHGGKANTRQIIGALAQEELHFEPGEDFLYSLCHDILGAVIEEVTGCRFSDYLREHIWKPLGLEHTGFTFIPSMEKTHTAQCWFNGFDKPLGVLEKSDVPYALSPEYESGGAGLISCAEDYAKFCDAIACGGRTADGLEILSPEMIRLWSTPQLCPRAKKTFDAWNRIGYSYALGVRTRVDTAKGRKGPVGEFGWDGAAGSYLFIDPFSHTSAFFAMHVRNFGYCYDVIHPTLQTLIYEAIEDK